MARILVTIALALHLIGCVSAGGVQPEPNAPTYSLRRSHAAERTVYARVQTVRVLGSEFSFQVRAPSLVEVRRFDEGRFLVHETYETPSYSEDGEPAPLPGRARQLTDVQTRSVLDAQSRLLEGPELTVRSGAGPLIEGALVALGRGLHLSFPDEPVAVGDRWTPPPARVSVESPIAMTLVVERTFVLAGVEPGEDGEGVARIEWEGEVRLPQFEAGGMALEGSGTILGASRVELRDGTVGTTDLDVRLSVGPRSTSDVLTLFSATVKYRDEVESTDDPGRSLVDGVRPVDPRPPG